MKIKTIIFTFVLCLFSGSVMSGTGHDHGHAHSHEPVSQDIAEQNASRIVNTLIKKGIIEKSWSGIAVDTAEKRKFDGKQEWVVSYKNEAASDPEKRKLYVFLTLTGNYIAANYTGK